MNQTADTLPKFQTDYVFIRTVAESKTQPCITFVEARSGLEISFMCAQAPTPSAQLGLEHHGKTTMTIVSWGGQL